MSRTSPRPIPARSIGSTKRLHGTSSPRSLFVLTAISCNRFYTLTRQYIKVSFPIFMRRPAHSFPRLIPPTNVIQFFIHELLRNALFGYQRSKFRFIHPCLFSQLPYFLFCQRTYPILSAMRIFFPYHYTLQKGIHYLIRSQRQFLTIFLNYFSPPGHQDQSKPIMVQAAGFAGCASAAWVS